MADVSLMKFAKLNGSNYRTWSFNMRLYLESHELFEHAEGTAESPGTDTSAEVRRKFTSDAKKAWTHICLAIEPEYQIHVRDTRTAKEAWDALKNQFARESLLQKVRLRQQYYSCRFRPGSNMLEHISHLRSLHDQLKEMGVNIDDKELAMTLLASLPEEFKPLITALDAVGDENISYDKVKNMLLNDVDRTKDSRSSEDAFSAKRGLHHKGKHNWNNEKKNKVFKGNCHNCQEKGHMARNCPKRNTENPNRKGKNGSANSAEKDDVNLITDDEALFTADSLYVSGWIIDSGATQHMTFEKNQLSDYVAFKQPCAVNLGDNRSILAYGKGTYHIVADHGDRVQNISLRDVLYLPELEKNLLSVRAMVKLGASVQFVGNECKITRNAKLLALGEIQGKLYMLKIVMNEQMNVAKDSNLKLWHYRYGHLGMDGVKKLTKGDMVVGMDGTTDESDPVCEGCIMGKQHRTKFPKGVAKRATEPFELVHSDVCGPMSVISIGGSKYFVTFIDDFSRYTYVYFVKHKDEVLAKFKEFVSMVKNHTGRNVKTFRTDNSGEYCSKEFESFLKEEGITHQLTIPYNPAQNGVSERMNRTLVESARSMMSHGKLPIEFWAESINTAVYLRNRSPTTSLNGITPYECLFGQKPDVSNLRVFGCVAFAHIPEKQRKKLDEKSHKVVFVGYPEGTKGYKLYDPVTRKFIRSRDVVFLEGKFHNFGTDSSTDLFIDYPQYHDMHVEIPHDQFQENENDNDETGIEPDEENLTDQRPNNQQVGASYEDKFMKEVEQLEGERRRKPPARFDEECYVASNLTADVNEPVDIDEAFSGEHSADWIKAAKSEFDSLKENRTWDLVPPPEGKNIVGSRWVFKAKRAADGSIQKYKARLVAKGYSQAEGIDYQEVFSPVARYNSIRSLLAVANICNWDIHQMDVKTAFLQGDLEDEIYMQQPEGFIDKKRPDYVCKLNKGIYGLKQAARCWNAAIDTYLLSSGYKKCSADPCVYMKSVKQKNGKIDFVIIALYVDDILWFSNNTEMLKTEKLALAKRFKVEDFGELHYVLGMLVKRNRELRTLSITQTKYLEGVLKRFDMHNCKPVSTPLEQGRKFEPLSEDEEPVDVQAYQMAIGCLTYATSISRPDIAAAVNVLSKFMPKPGKEHWQGIKRVLRYIQGTLNYGLMFTADGTDPTLIGYSDADWGGDASTRRSTTGYVFQIQNNTISWCSKRQASVARSTTEAEYMALSLACQEGIWLRRLLSDVQLRQRDASTIFEDNKGAIELAKNPKFHNRTKHIDISYHFVREQVEQNTFSVKYCPSEDMLADIMTKGLPRVTYERLRDKLGVIEIK